MREEAVPAAANAVEKSGISGVIPPMRAKKTVKEQIGGLTYRTYATGEKTWAEQLGGLGAGEAEAAEVLRQQKEGNPEAKAKAWEIFTSGTDALAAVRSEYRSAVRTALKRSESVETTTEATAATTQEVLEEAT